MPPDGIDTDLFSGGQILNYEFRDMLSQGDWFFLRTVKFGVKVLA